MLAETSGILLWTISPPPDPEKGCEQDSPHSPNSSPQVDASDAGEHGELRRVTASVSAAGDSPENTLLSSNDESASQASDDSSPSLGLTVRGRVSNATLPATRSDLKSDQGVPEGVTCLCGRAKARTDTGTCDLCTARQRAVANQLAKLDQEHA